MVPLQCTRTAVAFSVLHYSTAVFSVSLIGGSDACHSPVALSNAISFYLHALVLSLGMWSI